MQCHTHPSSCSPLLKCRVTFPSLLYIDDSLRSENDRVVDVFSHTTSYPGSCQSQVKLCLVQDCLSGRNLWRSFWCTDDPIYIPERYRIQFHFIFPAENDLNKFRVSQRRQALEQF